MSFGLLFHTKIISNYVEEELSYGELSLRNSDLIAENRDLIGENEMLVKLLKAEKEKFKNEMNIQQDKVNTEVQKLNDLQRDLQGRAPIILSHFGSIPSHDGTRMGMDSHSCFRIFEGTHHRMLEDH